MSNFFFLNKATAPEIVGNVFPQQEKFHDGFHVNSPYAIWDKHEDDPNFIATGLALKYRAKATDYISHIYYGNEVFLISAKFYELLRSFRCQPFVPLKAELGHRNKKYDFRFLLIRQGQEQYIDFQSTVFCINNLSGGWDEVEIKDVEEYLPLLEKTRLEAIAATHRGEKDTMISIYKLAIIPDALDFFVLKRGISKVIVSERLKTAIEAAGITGVSFSPVSEYRQQGVRMNPTPQS